MRSRRRVEPLDRFELDVPITREDAEAQARIRAARTLSHRDYLDWCEWITRDSVTRCRDVHVVPFEL